LKQILLDIVAISGNILVDLVLIHSGVYMFVISFEIPRWTRNLKRNEFVCTFEM